MNRYGKKTVIEQKNGKKNPGKTDVPNRFGIALENQSLKKIDKLH
jgi:hypothetical protein